MAGRSHPVALASASGLSVQLNANGSLRRIDHRDVIVNLFPGSEVEGGSTNLYLRRRNGRNDSTPLLGPRCPASYRISDQGFAARGAWGGIRFHVSLRLAHSDPAWFWHVARGFFGWLEPDHPTATSAVDLAFVDRAPALRQANPIALRYDEIKAGAVAFEGGWRVYSSGAGIAVQLIRGGVLTLNGQPLGFESQANPYRAGGAVVSIDALRARLVADRNTLLVQLR